MPKMADIEKEIRESGHTGIYACGDRVKLKLS